MRSENTSRAVAKERGTPEWYASAARNDITRGTMDDVAPQTIARILYNHHRFDHLVR